MTETKKRNIVYTVEIDETNLKDKEYYNNTNITYAFSSSNKVTISYNTTTAKPHADILYTKNKIKLTMKYQQIKMNDVKQEV